MKYYLAMALLFVFITPSRAQRSKYDKKYISKYGYEFLKELNKGRIKVTVSQEYRNIVTVHFNHSSANCKDVLARLTTYSGKVKEFHECDQYSFGELDPNDYPVFVYVKYKDTDGDMRETELVLTGLDVRYRIDIYKE